ncbi:P3 protein-like protein, partial [Aphelenchoides avenae]
VAYGLATFVLPEDANAVKFALLAVGCSPGGGKSSFWTIIFDGNLDLSISMTFVQTIGALGMMPLWIYTLGRTFFSQRVQVPLLRILQSLLFLLIPATCGMIFIHYKKHLLTRFTRWIKVITWFMTVFFTVFGIYANLYIIFLFNWRVVLCGCALPWSGYVIAYCVAALFRQKQRERITIAIETGVQNIGIALMMLLFSLDEPEVDLAMVMPFAIVLVTDKPLLVLYFAQKLYRRCTRDEKSKKGAKEPKAESADAQKIQPTLMDTNLPPGPATVTPDTSVSV